MFHFEDRFYYSIAQVTLFHFEDQLRENAAAVVKSLKEQAGMRVLMLTGDHSTTAERVAKSLGIDEFKSGLKPEDKLNEVKHLSQQNETGGLIMVGDGINDAPALAAATVGIVLAQNASATAVAVADVLLLQDAIDGVPFVIGKAHQTTSLVKISWSGAVHFLD
jgi:Cd2+/Zn2+-exporting ATPase